MGWPVQVSMHACVSVCVCMYVRLECSCVWNVGEEAMLPSCVILSGSRGHVLWAGLCRFACMCVHQCICIHQCVNICVCVIFVRVCAECIHTCQHIYIHTHTIQGMIGAGMANTDACRSLSGHLIACAYVHTCMHE